MLHAITSLTHKIICKSCRIFKTQCTAVGKVVASTAIKICFLCEDKYIFVCAGKLRIYGVLPNIWYSAHFWPKIWYSEYLGEIRTLSRILWGTEGSTGHSGIVNNLNSGKRWGRVSAYRGDLLRSVLNIKNGVEIKSHWYIDSVGQI